MSWPKLVETGTVSVSPDGKVLIEGFTFEHCTCRQAAQLAMAWATEKIGAALLEDMTADAPDLSAIG